MRGLDTLTHTHTHTHTQDDYSTLAAHARRGFNHQYIIVPSAIRPHSWQAGKGVARAAGCVDGPSNSQESKPSCT